jgi:Protein of unknown function (DUF3775)
MLKTLPELSISPEKLCFIIVKTREFEVEDVVAEDASQDPDDASAFQGDGGNAVREELKAFINALDEDEQIDLVTLAWLGRGDGTSEDWDELRAEATRAHNKRTATYLLGMPLLPDHLEEALSTFGLSCED